MNPINQHTSSQQNAAASAKPPAALTKILTAIGDGQDSPKEGLIRAFRKQDTDEIISSTSTLSPVPSGSYGYGSEQSAGDRAHNSNSSLESCSLLALPSGRTLLINSSEPIVLNAYRMLTVSTTLPQPMQRPVWSSYDYHIQEKLYTGYASKVYKAVCKRSSEVVVLKSYQLSAVCELYQHQIFREVGLHASLAHENVVQLSAAFQEGDFVVMVQEYAAGGNLFELLQKFGGRLTEHVAVQMVLEPFLRVLQYLHTRGIIHRDIKPENILFSSSMTLKLADFGLAIDLRRERAVTRAGTLDYMAPEVLNCPYKNKPAENKEKAQLHYSDTVDSWAVGVLAYELLVGCPPFYDSSRDRVEQRIRSSPPSFPRTMSENARSFITAALTKDPAKRPSVLQLLHHPWVNTYRARRSMRQINLSSSSSNPSSNGLTTSLGRQNPVAAAAPSGYTGGYAAKAKSALLAGNLAAAKAAKAAGPSVAEAAAALSKSLKAESKSLGYAAKTSPRLAAAATATASARAAATASMSASATASAGPSPRVQQLQQQLEQSLERQQLTQQLQQHLQQHREQQLQQQRAVEEQSTPASSSSSQYQLNSSCNKHASIVSKPAPAAGSPMGTLKAPSSPMAPSAAAAAAAAYASPFRSAATNLKTPRDQPSSTQYRTGMAGEGAAAAGTPLMASSKSSPLLVADLKELQLKAAYGPHIAAAEGCEALELRQRKKKWLGLKLWKEGGK